MEKVVLKSQIFIFCLDKYLIHRVAILIWPVAHWNVSARKVEHYKEIGSVISSDPPCEDGNAGFTTVPL